MIVILAGLPGTGKSTLASRLPGFVLNKDVIRAALFEPGRVEYTTEQDDFCQELMLNTAAYLLSKERSLCVFLDGRTYSRSYQRQRVIDFAGRLGVPWIILECVCSQQTALSRLARDAAEGRHPAANRTPDLYHAVRAVFEPVPEPKVVIDTDEDLEACLKTALGAISGTKANH